MTAEAALRLPPCRRRRRAPAGCQPLTTLNHRGRTASRPSSMARRGLISRVRASSFAKASRRQTELADGSPNRPPRRSRAPARGRILRGVNGAVIYAQWHRYATTGWLRERTLPAPPAHRQRTVEARFWEVMHLRDHVLAERTIRALLAVSCPYSLPREEDKLDEAENHEAH